MNRQICKVVGWIMWFYSWLYVLTGPPPPYPGNPGWQVKVIFAGTFIVLWIFWIRPKINLWLKEPYEIKPYKPKPYKPEPYKPKPYEIKPSEIKPISELPSFSENQGFEDPLSVMARANPERTADLIEQLSGDKLTAEVDKRSKEMVQEVLRNRPDTDEVTDRVTIIDKKGAFGILRRRKVHIENVAVRKKGDTTKP